ncbi:MAG TPA: hypothetical protein VG796_20015 [Verrucomicrobiales bacterium]|nr:hypothetical protein [Verrucomicrobiales bacterium]
MSDSNYEPPAAAISAIGDAGETAVHPEVIELFARTQRWVRIFSVVGLVATGVVFAMMIVSLSSSDSIFRQPDASAMQRFFFGALYALAIANVFPLVRLNRYAAAIRRLKTRGTVSELVTVVDRQRGFWTYVGIEVAAVSALYVIGGAVAVLQG